MKRTLMVSVAALALAAGSTIAMSQGNSGRGEGGGANAPMNNPAGASGGASGQMNESPAPGRGAQDRAVPEKQQKAQQAPSGTQAPNARQTQGEREQAPTTKQSQGERDKSGTQQQTQSPSAGGSKQGTAGTAGTMKSSNVSLTTEQEGVAMLAGAWLGGLGCAAVLAVRSQGDHSERWLHRFSALAAEGSREQSMAGDADADDAEEDYVAPIAAAE